jgi:pilus assembly protein FimV
MEESGDLDIDFAGGSDDAGSSDVIDLGAGADDDDVIDFGAAAAPADELSTDETGQVLIPPDTGSGIDFSLGDDEPSLEASATREMPTTEMSMDETGEVETGERTQVSSDDSVRTPTIEQQFDMEATGELPAMPDTGSDATVDIPPADATAEIDLDDLGLDLDGLEETAMAADIGEPDDIDGLSADDDLEATGRHAAADDLEVTGRHEMTEATSIQETLQVTDDDGSSTGVREALNVEEELTGTGELPMLDDDGDTTGIRQALSDDDATQLASLDDEDDDTAEDTGVGLDTSLLDATGQTQILTEDMAVQTATDIDANIGDADATMLAPSASDDEPNPVSSDAATLLAPMDEDEDEGDFDFAKTEALPKDVFSPDMSTDDTGRMPGLAGSTDMDLDLDDLTAALKVSEVGDTVNQLRDDATVEQPRIKPGQVADDDGPTQSIAPEDMSGDLHEARTMTEVGTKLDLARAYVDMGDPAGARSILEEVLDEGDEGQKQQAQQLIDSLPA